MDDQDEAMAGEYLAQRASARNNKDRNVLQKPSFNDSGSASTVLIDKEEVSLLELGTKQQKLGAGKNPAAKTSGLKKPSRVGQGTKATAD